MNTRPSRESGSRAQETNDHGGGGSTLPRFTFFHFCESITRLHTLCDKISSSHNPVITRRLLSNDGELSFLIDAIGYFLSGAITDTAWPPLAKEDAAVCRSKFTSLMRMYCNLIATQLADILANTPDNVAKIFIGMDRIMCWILKLGPLVTSQFVADIFSNMPQMWNALWRDRILLGITSSTSRLGEPLHELLVNYIKLCDARNCIPSLRSSFIAHVAFMCWFHEPPGCYHTKRFVVLSSIVTLRRTSDKDFDDFVKECVDEYGAKEYVLRLARDLDKPWATNAILLAHLEYLCTSIDPETLYGVSEGPQTIAQSLIGALRRQRRTGTSNYNWDISSIASAVIRWFTATSGDIVMKTLIVEYRITDVLCYMVAQFADPRPVLASIEMCQSLLQDFVRYVEQCPDRDCNVVLPTFRRHIRGEWLPILRKFHDMHSLHPGSEEHDAHVSLYDSWIELGAGLGFDVGREQARAFCSSKDCKYYSRKPRHLMRACVGCRQVCYCDRGCQKSDWKAGGHRSVCLRMSRP